MSIPALKRWNVGALRRYVAALGIDLALEIAVDFDIVAGIILSFVVVVALEHTTPRWLHPWRSYL